MFGIRYRNLSNKEDFKLLDVSWVEYVIFETKKEMIYEFNLS